MIGMTGGDIMVESVKQLSDSAHEELHDEVETIIKNMNDDDVLSTTSIRARQVGSASCADVTVEISPDLSTTATRAVEDRVQQYIRRELLQAHGKSSSAVMLVTVHAKPNLPDMVVCPLLSQQQDSANNHHNHDESTSKEKFDIHDNSATKLGSTKAAVAAGENGSTPLTSSTTTALSASQIEHQVRQQALLLYPKIHSTVTGVTVHYSSQNTVSVDCNIIVDDDSGGAGDDNDGNNDMATLSIKKVQGYASALQNTLEANIPEITSANIYLDLNSNQGKEVSSPGMASSVAQVAARAGTKANNDAATKILYN